MLVSNEFMLEDVTLHMILPVVYFRVRMFLLEVRRTVWGAFLSAVALEIRFLIFFQYGKVFFHIFFSRLSLCSPHLSLPLRVGMIMLYPLVGGGATSRSSRLG